MLGNFEYYNPTHLYFGENALDFLSNELKNYGKTVQLCYGKASIKANGIYDKVVSILKAAGKTIVEDGGVMPNPTVKKLYEGREIARKNNVDFILSVGGGSCCDYAKAVAASAYCDDDPWEKYYLKGENPPDDAKIIPIGCVLTMVGTGSEMNGGSVITNEEQKLKLGHAYGPRFIPKFAILNPVFTYTLPKYQMIAGIYDIFSHICEQYFSGNDDNTSDYIAEALMKSLIHSSRIAIKNPTDYEARSNIMWTATWALNTLIAKGKTEDWNVHKLGQSVGAFTDATHGMTLAAVSMPYYRLIMPFGLHKFKRFAENVWNISSDGKTDAQTAEEGLKAMESWMNELGLVMNISDLGATPDMLDGIAKGVFASKGGYKILDKNDIMQVLRESMQK